ncbi:MAG TPA: glycosyltransferase family 2 protein [Candidatus Omnitrophota bacterium]|jgi:cellulose synthase/poly-beta-1,6-N-acetylglucosamine synthase-like glycosyltransferase|nr:glycosyltransferase family 2 protein [Candidatus Omnitrophota bacterium]HQB93865.1 glycosyltransferase family 2 protein [Candidatus Omnitrophota bacterium]
MNFVYSRQGLRGGERVLQRFLEVIPGVMSWTLVIGFIVTAFWQPVIASIFVILFMLSWVMRLFYYLIFLMLSYARLRYEKDTDWLSRMRELDRLPDAATEEPGRSSTAKGWGARLSCWSYRQDLREIRRREAFPPPSSDIYHLVLIPVIKESREVIEGNLSGLLRNRDLLKRMVVAIALESRAPAEVKDAVRALKREYSGRFLDLLVVEHPDGLPGEARVKGANASHAAKAAGEFFRAKSIPFENVIVSCFDADTVVGPDYFACLTYTFMACPDRYRASFQPIPVYHNNIWKVPGFARVVETGSSFFQLVEMTNPEKLVTFSSHSMSFRALVDVGYWPPDMISDDSGIFWKAYLHFDGDYRVVPIPVTISMDVVDAGSWWRTCLSLYKQKRRWAWGVENFPLVLRGFLRNKKIPLYDKCRHAFKLLEGHVTWAALPFLLTFVGWLPAILSGREFSNTVLYFHSGRVTQTIFSLSSLVVLGTVILSTRLLPPKRKKFNLFWNVIHSLEWLLVPVILLFLSALPALDAQTRLMSGRYMEFWVSDKRRSKTS